MKEQYRHSILTSASLIPQLKREKTIIIIKTFKGLNLSFSNCMIEYNGRTSICQNHLIYLFQFAYL